MKPLLALTVTLQLMSEDVLVQIGHWRIEQASGRLNNKADDRLLKTGHSGPQAG